MPNMVAANCAAERLVAASCAASSTAVSDDEERAATTLCAQRRGAHPLLPRQSHLRTMRKGDTRLIDAARHGRAADVAALLADGADVNEPKEYGMTALFIACENGHVYVEFANPAAVADVFEAHVIPHLIARLTTCTHCCAPSRPTPTCTHCCAPSRPTPTERGARRA